MFVHHVFFWLKPDLATEDVQLFEKGVTSLKEVGIVKIADIGKPASTDRPVIDRSYSYSLLLVFDSLEDHDTYQVDPIHTKFVADCAHLWERVKIYDSETI
ncbi:Dabb family protein [Adhaeribacter aquaticus]|uniref:Dabb family protein n=1 Tax=Adhaeribacter aquaticus TaxID=299567 RepID=UPI00047A2773|nr:Dabb family protein [Adhaeribacter aquaticus]